MAIKANFSAYSSYVVDSLHQWDLNQVLTVEGLNLATVPEVHFSNKNMDRAIVRQATMTDHVVRVNIPNSLLQDPLRIYAHIGIYEGSTFKVVETVEIPVIPRTRPCDYQFEDTDGEIYSYNRLENMIENINETWYAMNAEQVQTTVTNWLDDHPEATTTVQDRSLTADKLVVGALGYVTPQMFGAKGDGVTDDTAAVQAAVSTGGIVRIENGRFLVTATIELPGEVSIYFDNAKIVKTNNPSERILEANGVDNIRIYNAVLEGGGSDNNVSDQGSALFFYNCNGIYVDGLKTRNTYGDGLQLRNCIGRFVNLDIDDYGRNAISPTSGDIEVINARLGTGLAGANPSCNVDIEPNSATEPSNVLLSNVLLHDRVNIYDAYSADKLGAAVRIENCHFVGAYRAILVKAVNNVSGESIHIADNNLFDGVGVGGITIDNVNDMTLDGLAFVNTSPAQINLQNTTSGITLKNIKSFYLYGATCEGLTLENCKIGYYGVTSAKAAIFKNCQMNRFASGISFDGVSFDSTSEQTFSSGSDFSVSVPVPDNSVKSYLVTVNANGKLATVKTAIIVAINGSAYREVHELASHGSLAVDYALADGLLTITPSDNYGGTIVVKSI